MSTSPALIEGSKEQNLLSSVYLNLEHFIKISSIFIAEADSTNKFWETSANKIPETLKKPSRRLIKESKTNPLTLMNAGRFSSHAFYLFNDLFIHSQSSSFVLHQLETVWVDTPSTESASQQCLITITTPEDILVLNAGTPQNKTEWLVAFNTAINKVLSIQKHISHQNIGDQWGQTPVIRHAFHTFTKHALFKDATYKGYWMNGKVHGMGFIKWPDGRKYKGRFAHSTMCGLGKLVIPKENKTEEVLEGMWKDGNLHGQGKISYSNGDMYEGCFKDGLRHGHGVYRKGKYLSSASFVYMGEWLFDKKHGYGVMDDIVKGEKHMGMWQEDNCHGDGVVVTLDGMYFEGNFQLNKLVGHGLMLTDDNSCYEGEFSGITLLQGKGCLTFPNADKIEGTFNGTWNQGLKISGTFWKAMLPSTTEKKSWNKPLETRSSLYGKLCVKPDRKWEEIFYQCYESLHYSGEGEPNTAKAWNQVVSSIVSGKQRLKVKDKSSLTSKDKMELSILVQLEKIPAHSVELLTLEHFLEVKQYLIKAFETCAHPLGKVAEDLIDVFRAAYIGIGAHPRLLYHAVQEIHSYIKRIYRVIRILFPELPASGKPTYVYSDKHHHDCIPITEDTGFLQKQYSETLDDQSFTVVVSAPGILQPILLPKIYPALFDLYALHSDREDEKYWERIQKLNKQGDLSLMAFLGIDQKFWCFDESLLKENKMISSIKDHSYFNAVEILQQISTAFCPYDKLEVIQKTFLSVSETVSGFTSTQQMLTMDDLFPIFQFVVVRARIHHLGAEIRFIEELMESHLEFGEHGIMFTTLKACYYQIQN